MRLEIKNLEKSFTGKKALDGVSFIAESGSAFGLIGRNGAGKTTTLRILMNVFNPEKGEILVNDKPIDYRTIQLGYLPEERGLYQKKKIKEQLVYFTELKTMSRTEAVGSVDYWLKRLNMDEYKNCRLDTLSKGNQQKIQLITALAHNPDIVILDEPFSGLDPVNAQLLKTVVKEIVARGKIVIFSSHQMNYIEEFCDNIAILDNGQIVQSGNINQIKRYYPRNRLLIKSKNLYEIAEMEDMNCAINSNNEIICTLDNPSDKNRTMSKLIDKFDIDEIKVLEPSLNDIFIESVSKDDIN